MDEPTPTPTPTRQPEPAEAPEAGVVSEPLEASGAFGEDEEPRPLGIGVGPTGHPGVDAVLARLTDADHLAVGGHGEVYEDVHRGLRDTLTALDVPQPHPVTPRS